MDVLPDLAAPVTATEIARVHDVIAPYIRRTPVLRVTGADIGLGPFPLTFKLEFMQHGGSFKARGAFANLLTRAIPPAGVVAASGGNHGVAVAVAARRLGVPATIFLPTVSSPVKIARIRAEQADVVVTGDRYAEALEASEAFAARTQALSIHAYDQAETMLGQGTLARELSEQAPDAATVLIAVGGGGLIGGVAAWYGGRGTRVIGVEPSGAPTLFDALKAGRPVDAPAGSIAADSLAPRRVGELMFPIARRHVDRVILVEDEEIVRAQNVLWEFFRIVVEPGGAAALAAVLSGRYVPAAGEHVAVVLCGANTQR
ncbi:MAG TPA: threonine/serine dehydratase [Vicinamibacterales bacterium]|nr:threonine/serine dehydratase [Vicinamibacterales bacterium]